MYNFTPGPWHTDLTGHSVWSKGGRWICDVWPKTGGAYPPEQSKYNARLIAASPNMLVALEYARDILSEDDPIVEKAIIEAVGYGH